MKKSDLKLEFIENGRLTNGEMGEVVGGKETCRRLSECEGGGDFKRECMGYRDCETSLDRFKCGVYKNFVIGFEYTYDTIEEVWCVEVRG